MRIILRSSSNQNGTCILFQLHIFYKIYLVIDPAYTYTLTLTQTLMKGSLCIFQCILTPLMAKMHYCNFAIKGVKKNQCRNFDLNLEKVSLNNNVNAVVLGQMYRSMLSSFLRIGEQYLPPCFARQKVLSLNSSE